MLNEKNQIENEILLKFIIYCDNYRSSSLIIFSFEIVLILQFYPISKLVLVIINSMVLLGINNF